jgi:hypothetical protein
MVYQIAFVLKSSWVISHVNVELKINVSEISVFIIRVDVMNGHMSLIFIPVCQIDASSYCSSHSLTPTGWLQHWCGWSHEEVLAHLFSVKASNLTNSICSWSYGLCFCLFPTGRSIITKKSDGSQVKESTDSSTTLEDDDVKGKQTAVVTYSVAFILLPWSHYSRKSR